MDEIDRAQEREQQDRDASIKARKPQVLPCGTCYNCGDPVEGIAEFCDSDCGKDYELREASRVRSGK